MSKGLRFVLPLAISLWSGVALAQPVEYVRVCAAYGARFLYVPGTDTCLDPTTGETRRQTASGTFRHFVNDSPFQWVPSPAAGCFGGRLVELGSVAATSFVLNKWDRYAAPLAPMSLAPGDYVASYMLGGSLTRRTGATGLVRLTGVPSTEVPSGTELSRADGFIYFTTTTVELDAFGEAITVAQAVTAGADGIAATGTVLSLTTPPTDVDSTAVIEFGFDAASTVSTARSNLCVAYDDPYYGYVQLGCGDVGKTLAESPATLAVTPRHAVPPSYLRDPGLVAYVPDALSVTGVEGAAVISACVRNSNADGAACRIVTGADPNVVTLDCGTSSVPISNGTNGTNGTSCSVADNNDGTATMSCPDGSSVSLLTPAGVANASSDGCSNAPGASLLAMIAIGATLLRRVRP